MLSDIIGNSEPIDIYRDIGRARAEYTLLKNKHEKYFMFIYLKA